MERNRRKILIGLCLSISCAGHLLFLSAFGKLGALHFGLPVSVIQQVVVDLKTPLTPVTPTFAKKTGSTDVSPPSLEPNDIPSGHQDANVPTASETSPPVKGPVAPPTTTEQITKPPAAVSEQSSVDKLKPIRPPKTTAFVPDQPLRSTGEFMGSEHEKQIGRASCRERV